MYGTDIESVPPSPKSIQLGNKIYSKKPKYNSLYGIITPSDFLGMQNIHSVMLLVILA